MVRRIEPLFLIAGIGLAGFVLWTIVVGSTSAEAPATVLSEPPVATTVPVPVTEVVEVTETPPPPPEVAQLSGSISAVLGDNGHTSLTPRADLEEELPASVVAVLVDRDIVLTLTEPAEPDETSTP